MPHHRKILRSAAATLCAATIASSVAIAQSLEVLGSTRVSNREQTITFHIPPHQANVSELRLRSGTLNTTFVGLEIEFRDGGLQRMAIREALPAGHQSRAIPVNAVRTISTVSVEIQPGLRPGTTAIQLLGKLAPQTSP